MKIGVIGAGYVGLSLAAVLADKGNLVTCVDRDREKIEQIKMGESPLKEEGLDILVQENIEAERLKASSNEENAIKDAKIIFIAVNTPTENGQIQLQNLKDAVKTATNYMTDNYPVLAIKSTLTPGSTRKEILPLLQENGMEPGEDCGVCVNPEFLSQGTAIQDVREPDRIVIGELDEKSGELLSRLYSDFESPVIRESMETAEMIKYASNSLLATKISFINEIGNLCKELDVDIYDVAEGVGMDSRISREFLDSGTGFGGSCLEKDIEALISLMKNRGIEGSVLEAIMSVNESQKVKPVEILEERIGSLEGKRIGILGLSFKPGTADVTNSPAIDIINQLINRGAEVTAYDPEANENMKKIYGDIEYSETYTEVLEGSDAAILVTDWEEFNNIDRGDLKKMSNPLLIEGRKIDHNAPEKFTEGVTWP
ncbi:MAG: UDP-glucose/GDP-mannose dehydrogenase family protein [Candidatus Nanosalina sp.]